MSTFDDLFTSPLGCLAAWALAIVLASRLMHRWDELDLGPVHEHEARDRRFQRAAALAAFAVVAALVSTLLAAVRMWGR